VFFLSFDFGFDNHYSVFSSGLGSSFGFSLTSSVGVSGLGSSTGVSGSGSVDVSSFFIASAFVFSSACIFFFIFCGIVSIFFMASGLS